MKSEVADDLESSKEINSARGDWILRYLDKYKLLQWVTDVDFDASLLLWHVATDLLHSCNEKDEDETKKSTKEDLTQEEAKEKSYRIFSKRLSDYMLYLLMMQSTMMSTVAGIGEIRFRDTCAEAKIFFKGRGIKKDKGKTCSCCCNCFGKKKDDNKNQKKEEDNKNQKKEEVEEKRAEEENKKQKAKEGCCGCLEEERTEEEEDNEKPDALLQRACWNLLLVNTAAKPVAVKGDRSKSVLFDACMLAKELNLYQNKWEIMSKVWVELLCYAASRCRATRHAAQLSKGGELLTIVWLLMAHFGLGNEFQISEGHARAKLIVGK